METHAHEFNKKHNIRKGWILWSYTEKTGDFSIWAYDDGIGIPEHIKQNPDLVEKMMQYKRSFLQRGGSDDFWIEQAIRQNRSSTELKNRGTGLPQIINVATNNKGSVSILSGKGQFIKGDNHKWDDEISFTLNNKINKKYSIKGTIISWRFSLTDDLHS